MLKFILKRLMFGFFVLIGVVVVVFFIFQVLPGDPIAMRVNQHTDPETMEIIRKEYGLDQPKWKQLALYLNDLSPVSVHEQNDASEEKYEYTKIMSVGDNSMLVLKYPYFRRSISNDRRVNEIIAERIGGTFWLALSAILFATIFGVLMGVYAAIKQNTFVDHLMVITSVIGISIPSFVAGALIALVFAFQLGWFQATGSLYETAFNPHTLQTEKTLALQNLILPALTLGIRPLAIIVQLTRDSMLEVLKQDYMRTARAKGVSFSRLIFKHGLKNALNPVITAVSGWLAQLLAGAFFVELIFQYKGLGKTTLDAVTERDFPIVMGAVIVVAIIFIFVNIIVDILYAVIDPRVRLK